ncbi:MAG: hypothetical protein K8F25_10200 [Fimbriimonadaceae bacterium]|nr:hypothetical protein [Alphaproteobacteria bacterium]
MANETTTRPAMWRVILAFILDLLTSFFVFGYIIAKFTGNTTESGFELNGMPAIILFALVIAYFVVGRKFLGGTLWQRILGAR